MRVDFRRSGERTRISGTLTDSWMRGLGAVVVMLASMRTCELFDDRIVVDILTIMIPQVLDSARGPELVVGEFYRTSNSAVDLTLIFFIDGVSRECSKI